MSGAAVVSPPAPTSGATDLGARGRQLRVRIDWIRCDGYGLCGDLAPDLIELDEWRYPILRPGLVDPAHRGELQRAADCCPMKAIVLERVRPDDARRT